MTSLEDIAQVALAQKKAQFSVVDLGNGRVDDHFGCTVKYSEIHIVVP